eukprot:6391706-Amphidinium_carterae.1
MLNSYNITPAMMLLALTGQDLTDEPIPRSNLNLLPSTLPKHPYTHNFSLTGLPWNLALITDYTPNPARPLTDSTIAPTVNNPPRFKPPPPGFPKRSPPTMPSTISTRPHPPPVPSTNRPTPPTMRPPPWRYSDPQSMTTRGMSNPFTTPTGLSFDLGLIDRCVWTRLLPIDTNVGEYANSLYDYITTHQPFHRLRPVIDLLMTAFIHLGHVLQMHICSTPSCRNLHVHSHVTDCTTTALTVKHIHQHFNHQWSATQRYLNTLEPRTTQVEEQLHHIVHTYLYTSFNSTAVNISWHVPPRMPNLLEIAPTDLI